MPGYCNLLFLLMKRTKVSPPSQSTAMSERELNSYRFLSHEEPTDEMLAQIMKEVADDASKENVSAKNAFFEELRKGADEMQAKWADRINQARHAAVGI